MIEVPQWMHMVAKPRIKQNMETTQDKESLHLRIFNVCCQIERSQGTTDDAREATLESRS